MYFRLCPCGESDFQFWEAYCHLKNGRVPNHLAESDKFRHERGVVGFQSVKLPRLAFPAKLLSTPASQPQA